ncbi:hypothetical protein JR666_001553 [Salmonella enterica]|nr:hypothetical protein [Salmonella enterica]
MVDISSRDPVEKPLAVNSSHSESMSPELSAPVVDTHMVVTLDELHPYELDPRLTRNPRYDEIKMSIRERGLDAPPPITRRPGATHYIIRNGGNTRLAILRELWSETKDERFFRIGCLFRPWPERGEIIALTGHLAENELHGGLSFIERALGVEKARELYQQELGKPLSQSELARRLKNDGYPVPQPHISRMQEAILYLLPAIPTVLYNGLGRHQIEQLTSLRRAASRIWEKHAIEFHLPQNFPDLFLEVLSPFDALPGAFSVQRVQDELIGQMAELLKIQYDTLTIEIMESENRWQLLTSEPEVKNPPPESIMIGKKDIDTTTSSISEDGGKMSVRPGQNSDAEEISVSPSSVTGNEKTPDAPDNSQPEAECTGKPDSHIVSPIELSDRLQSLQRLVAGHLGETPSEFRENALRTIPVQVDGLYPITDVWYIDPALDEPERLRLHIAQFAREIAEEAGQPHALTPSCTGPGFNCSPSAIGDPDTATAFTRAVMTLLDALSFPYQENQNIHSSSGEDRLANDLAPLLMGGELRSPGQELPARISDAGLVRLFRLLRLARRLFDLETGISEMGGVDAMPEP